MSCNAVCNKTDVISHCLQTVISFTSNFYFVSINSVSIIKTVEFYHSNEINIDKLYISTAEETAASEVALDAFTLQHFKCINHFIRLMFYIFF